MNFNKVHLLIPLILFSYLLIMNLQSSQIREADGSYIIDVGSRNDMLRDVKLTGPEDRISEPLKETFGDEKINFRNFNNRFVYFQLEEPKIKNTSIAKVQIRFRDELPKGYVFKVGAHNAPQWNYKWNLLYDPFQRQIEEEYNTVYSDSNISIYSLKDNTPEFSNIPDFLTKLEVDNTLAIQPSISLFPGTEELPASDNSTTDTTANTTLRGKHTFLTYAAGSELSIDIEKQDLNWYNGTDELRIKILSGEGKTVASAVIPDDGDVTDHRGMGDIQKFHTEVTGLNTGTYKMIIDANDDTLMKNLKVSSGKLIVENNVFAYTPTKLFTFTDKDQAVNLMTLHKEGLQTINVSNNNQTYNATIDQIAVTQSAKIKDSAGIQKIDIPSGDLQISSDMYFSFTEGSYFNPMKCSVVSLNNDFEWLKDNHVDYVIMKNQTVRSENGWVTAETEWKVNDLYIRNNVLDFSTNIEHRDDSAKINVPVDWIRITLE